MNKNILLGLLVFLIASCGTQKQLQREFIGEPISVVGESFGAPQNIIDTKNGKVYIFEKEEKLRSTEIDQGKLTLDPIVTPRVLKIERYFFTVENGVIKNVRFEEEYER